MAAAIWSSLAAVANDRFHKLGANHWLHGIAHKTDERGIKPRFCYFLAVQARERSRTRLSS